MKIIKVKDMVVSAAKDMDDDFKLGLCQESWDELIGSIITHKNRKHVSFDGGEIWIRVYGKDEKIITCKLFNHEKQILDSLEK